MSNRPIIKSMTQRYVLFLGILAGILITDYFAFSMFIVDQESNAAFINVSGRQRMLSQRVALHVTHIATTNKVAVREKRRGALLETVQVMERSHEGLINGDKGMNLTGKLSPEVRDLYFKPPYEIDKNLRSFLADARSVADAPEGEIDQDDPRVLRIQRSAIGPLLGALNIVVAQHQMEGEANMERLGLVIEIGLAASLFLLVLSAFGIFRPLVRQTVEEMDKMKNAERNMRTILNGTVDGIITINERGIIKNFNPAAQSIFGYPGKEAIGLNVSMLMPEPHRNNHDNYLSNYITTGIAKILGVGREVEGQRKDGTQFPIRIAISESFVNNEVIFIGIVHDLTVIKMHEKKIEEYQHELEEKVEERTRKLVSEVAVRRRVEAALHESQQHLQSITESIFEGVIAIETHGHIVFANNSAQTLLEPQGGVELSGSDLDDIFQLKGTDGLIYFDQSPFHRVVETGETIRDDDAFFVTSGGKELNVAYACSSLLEDNKLSGAIISFRDIHQLKEAQQEAFQATKLASVGQLAAGIAHEINTPIQYIGDNLRFLSESHATIADILEQCRELVRAAREMDVLDDLATKVEIAFENADIDYLKEEIPQASEQSLGGVDQVSRIVLAMKEFSHPGTREKTPTDLNQAIENTLIVCRNEWKLVAEMDVDFDPSLPPVNCLPGEMNQVFLNLITNAAHAIAESGRDGLGHISVSSRRDGNWVELRVADTGGGIPAAIRDRVFDPFYTTKEVGKGTGQGLSVCRDIVVKKHHGKIFFETETGKGTVFVVRLPVDGQTSSIEDER